MDTPRYSYPLHLVPGLLASLFFGSRRSFQQDSIACLDCLQPPLRVLGAGNIPPGGPYVVCVNHYHRPGFGAWWIAIAVTACLPQELHWVMTAELTFPGRWYGFIGRPLSRWFLRRMAGLYGFTAMPPMPPRLHEVQARANAVRLVLEHARRDPHAVLAIAPEGGDAPAGTLASPSPGAGRFLLQLARTGRSILPVGCWEQDGFLCLQFGTPFQLHVPPGLGADGRDRVAAEVVMGAIATQLPSDLRGDFPAS